MNTENNQRRFQRIRFNASTQLIQAEIETEVRLLDLSLKGLLVACPDSLTLNEGETLEARISLEGGTCISMTVSLSHQEATQLGFKCEMIDVESISHLRRLVELNLGDAQAAERELSELAAID